MTTGTSPCSDTETSSSVVVLATITHWLGNNESIKIFNNGNMSRSFTYIEDIIDIIFKLINNPALPDKNFDRTNPNPSTSWNSHRIFNLGNEKTTNLIDFIETLEFEIGIKANRIYENMQPGDVQHTSSDCSLIKDWVGMVPKTSLKDGIRIFINWYKEFYNFP